MLRLVALLNHIERAAAGGRHMIGRGHTHSRFETTHIDMVPMVDCIMVLVIFLMISSAFVSDPGVEVQKPDVSGAINIGPECAAGRDHRGQPHLFRRAGNPHRPGRGGVETGGDRSFAGGDHPRRSFSDLGVFAAVYTEAKRSGIQHVQFATTKSEGI